MKVANVSVQSLLPSILFDFVAIAVIFLLPSFSHLTGIAIYKFDPMRIALFAAILFTNRKNAYLIAFLLPVVSFIISAHPYFYKVFLISTELILNVWLFYFFLSKFKNVFLISFTSIIISKAIYYGLKLFLLNLLLINDPLVSTSILIQIIVAISISAIISVGFYKSVKNL